MNADLDPNPDPTPDPNPDKNPDTGQQNHQNDFKPTLKVEKEYFQICAFFRFRLEKYYLQKKF